MMPCETCLSSPKISICRACFKHAQEEIERLRAEVTDLRGRLIQAAHVEPEVILGMWDGDAPAPNAPDIPTLPGPCSPGQRDCSGDGKAGGDRHPEAVLDAIRATLRDPRHQAGGQSQRAIASRYVRAVRRILDEGAPRPDEHGNIKEDGKAGGDPFFITIQSDDGYTRIPVKPGEEEKAITSFIKMLEDVEGDPDHD